MVGEKESERKYIKAEDCECVVCGKQAVAFWPCIDPDIQSHPYCQKDLDEAQRDLLLQMYEEDKKRGW